MIHVTSIRTVNINKYDKVYAIVRSLKSKSAGIEQLAALSPSWDLFKKYRSWVEKNEWSADTFGTEYVPQFIRELAASQEATQALHMLADMDAEGKNIALVCFCPDENLCHRSIIAGILKGFGCDVRTDYLVIESYRGYDELYRNECQRSQLSESWDQARNALQNALDMLTGCWNRIHVSNDIDEIRTLRENAYCYVCQAIKFRKRLTELDKDVAHMRGVEYKKRPIGPPGTDFDSCKTVLQTFDDTNILSDYGMLAAKLIQVVSNTRLSQLEKRNDENNG